MIYLMMEYESAEAEVTRVFIGPDGLELQKLVDEFKQWFCETHGLEPNGDMDRDTYMRLEDTGLVSKYVRSTDERYGCLYTNGEEYIDLFHQWLEGTPGYHIVEYSQQVVYF